MNTKALLIGLVFTMLIFSLNAQSTYTVIKVFGGIQYKTTKKAMTQGDKYSSGDALIFDNSDAKAAVVNKEKGRFMITPPASGKLDAPPNFVPAMGNVSMRAGLLNNSLEVKNHFSGNYLILNKVFIKISSQTYPMSDTTFFYMTYTYKGEQINKKLAFTSDSLIIERSTLFTVDGSPIPNPDLSVMRLYYLSNNKASFISEFNPVFPDLNALKAEISVLLHEISDKNYQEKLDEVLAYLNEFYGKPNIENVKEWLHNEFKLSPAK